MFSQTVEYGLRAMICLADGDQLLHTSESLSQKTRVPQAYLSKVLKGLVQSGLIRSQRGVNGGFSLGRAAKDITILQVVNAIDPLKRIHQCPLQLDSHGNALCPLHHRMDQSLAQMEATFASSTLADILAEPSLSKPLCGIDSASPACMELTLPS